MIVSQRDPALRIDCEVNLFVEAARKKQVQRCYWIQFEAFVPSAHRTVSVQLAAERAATRRVGLEHVLALLSTAGYRLPEGMVNVRLVHVPAASNGRLSRRALWSACSSGSS